jgi:hypothetical protein
MTTTLLAVQLEIRDAIAVCPARTWSLSEAEYILDALRTVIAAREGNVAILRRPVKAVSEIIEDAMLLQIRRQILDILGEAPGGSWSVAESTAVLTVLQDILQGRERESAHVLTFASKHRRRPTESSVARI